MICVVLQLLMGPVIARYDLMSQEKDNGGKGRELEHSVRARNEMTKRLNKRRATENSLHSIALQMNGRALTRMHDAGLGLP